jgi:GntR family transcriptional regulator/MocR family aminotransferase
MAEFMHQVHFSSHIRRMRIVYSRRNEILQETVRKHFDTTEVLTVGTDAGLHLALKFPTNVDDKAIAQEANALGIAVRPLSSYFHSASTNDTGLVLGYACVEDMNIELAFVLLAKAIRESLHN